MIRYLSEDFLGIFMYEHITHVNSVYFKYD